MTTPNTSPALSDLADPGASILVQRSLISKIQATAQLHGKNLDECRHNSGNIREIADGILAQSGASAAGSEPILGMSALARAKAGRAPKPGAVSGGDFVPAIDRALELSARATPTAAFAAVAAAYSACDSATLSTTALSFRCYLGNVLRRAGAAPSAPAAAAALNSIRAGRASILGLQ